MLELPGNQTEATIPGLLPLTMYKIEVIGKLNNSAEIRLTPRGKAKVLSSNDS